MTHSCGIVATRMGHLYFMIYRQKGSRSMKKRWNSIIRGCLFVICMAVFLYSVKEVYMIYKEYHVGTNVYDNLYEEMIIEVPEVSTETLTKEETIDVEEETVEENDMILKEESIPIAVDFEALWKTCPDVVAWLYSPNTKIHYPIVQGEDNTYYLEHLADKTPNSSGSLMLDCRNTSDFSDWNSMIHGHSMKNGSMFRSLLQYKKQQYYDEHPIMWLITPDETYKVELFAGYITSSDDSVYSLSEDTGLVERAVKASTFKSDVEVLEEESLLTLSTCSYENENARYILLGVIRKK